MTQSMTGFARGSVTTPLITVIVEMRSVNNRFLDLHFRCPENLRAFEGSWRKTLSRRLDRGKVEVSVRLQAGTGTDTLLINTERLDAIGSGLEQVGIRFPESTPPDRLALLQAPGVMASDQVDEQALASAVAQALSIALDELVGERSREGDQLAAMVRERVDSIRGLLAALQEHLPTIRAQQRQRLLDRLEDAGVEPDARRLEEELVYVAQRSDVDEEMDRLGAHLEAILVALDGNAPCGRRLDFLMQELNREANTLSSKATSLTTTNTAVEFKVLIEQMREQVQNIE